MYLLHYLMCFLVCVENSISIDGVAVYVIATLEWTHNR